MSDDGTLSLMAGARMVFLHEPDLSDTEAVERIRGLIRDEDFAEFKPEQIDRACLTAWTAVKKQKPENQ